MKWASFSPPPCYRSAQVHDRLPTGPNQTHGFGIFHSRTAADQISNHDLGQREPMGAANPTGGRLLIPPPSLPSQPSFLASFLPSFFPLFRLQVLLCSVSFYYPVSCVLKPVGKAPPKQEEGSCTYALLKPELMPKKSRIEEFRVDGLILDQVHGVGRQMQGAS